MLTTATKTKNEKQKKLARRTKTTKGRITAMITTATLKTTKARKAATKARKAAIKPRKAGTMTTIKTKERAEKQAGNLNHKRKVNQHHQKYVHRILAFSLNLRLHAILCFSLYFLQKYTAKNIEVTEDGVVKNHWPSSVINKEPYV